MINTPNQIQVKILKGSVDHIIVPNTLKITFDLELTSTDKARSVVNNVGRTLVKKVLRFSLKEIDVINNPCIYDAYKGLYLSEKEREERLLQGIQTANGLKDRLDAKTLDGTALTLTTQENVIKKTYDKRFVIPLDFEFFKDPVYPSGFEEDLTITIELNSAKEMILCTGETNAIYKISDINLEYDGIFDISYATSIREIYSGRLSIPYTKLTSIHY